MHSVVILQLFLAAEVSASLYVPSYTSVASTLSLTVPSPGDFTFLYNQFANCKSTTAAGGAISLLTVSNLTIWYSSFQNCSAIGYTSGALNCPQLNSVNIFRTCFYQCYSTLYYQSFYIASSIAVLGQYSVCRCPYSGLGQRYTTIFSSAIIAASDANYSNNAVSYFSSGLYFSSSSSSSYMSRVTVSSVSPDIAAELNTGSGCSLNSANIVNNTCTGGDQARLIFVYLSYVMNNCIVAWNTQTTVIQIYNSNGHLSLNGCYIQSGIPASPYADTTAMLSSIPPLNSITSMNLQRCLNLASFPFSVKFQISTLSAIFFALVLMIN